MDRRLRDDIAGVEDRHWWYAGRRRIVASVLDGIDRASDSALLEIGCGGGANLAMLSRYGDVFAVEPDTADRDRAAARSVGVVADGSLPDALPFPDRAFDVILLLDVLEHVADDRAGLAAVYDRLRPGGRVILTVPAHPWLWSAHDTANHHMRRYTRRSFASLISSSRLVTERMAWFNGILFPIVVAQRSIGRLVGLDRHGVGLPPAIVNRALGTILGSERHALGRLPFGVSLLAVARRD